MFVSHFPTQVRRKFQSGGHSAEVMNVMRLDGLEKKKVLTITLHFKQMLPRKRTECTPRNLTYNEHYNKSSLDITMHCSRHCSANLPCRALGYMGYMGMCRYTGCGFLPPCPKQYIISCESALIINRVLI